MVCHMPAAPFCSLQTSTSESAVNTHIDSADNVTLTFGFCEIKSCNALSTVYSRPLRLINSDQLLFHLPGWIDQFMESPECHGFLLFIVWQVTRLISETDKEIFVYHKAFASSFNRMTLWHYSQQTDGFNFNEMSSCFALFAVHLFVWLWGHFKGSFNNCSACCVYVNLCEIRIVYELCACYWSNRNHPQLNKNMW